MLALIRQRLLQRSFQQFRVTVAAGEPLTTVMKKFEEDYNRHLGTCDYVEGVEQITQESLEAALRLPKSKAEVNVPDPERPAQDVQQALAALVNPREYVAYDSAVSGDQNWALLEVLLRFAERRLTHDVTAALLDRIDQVVAAWSPVAAARADMAARLSRIKASVDLLRLDDHQ